MSDISDKHSKEVDFDSLRFIRVFTPMHIPKELIEQVRERHYEVEDWFKYQEIICLRHTEDGPHLNPFSMLYVIADEGNKVVGTLWCEVDALSKALVIQTFSMDKKYWCKGKAVTLLVQKAKEILKECKLKKAMWMTSYPKHSERYGFKRSRSVLMEYKEEEDGRYRDGINETCGECPPIDATAVGLHKSDPSGDRSGSELSYTGSPTAV